MIKQSYTIHNLLSICPDWQIDIRTDARLFVARKMSPLVFDLIKRKYDLGQRERAIGFNMLLALFSLKLAREEEIIISFEKFAQYIFEQKPNIKVHDIPCPPRFDHRMLPGEMPVGVKFITWFFNALSRTCLALTDEFRAKNQSNIISCAWEYNTLTPEPAYDFLLNLLTPYCKSDPQTFLSPIFVSVGNNLISGQQKQLLKWIETSTPWMLKYCVLLLCAGYAGTKTVRKPEKKRREYITLQQFDYARAPLWSLHKGRNPFGYSIKPESGAIYPKVYLDIARQQMRWYLRNKIPLSFSSWLLPVENDSLAPIIIQEKSKIDGLDHIKHIAAAPIYAAPLTIFTEDISKAPSRLNPKIKKFLMKNLPQSMWRDHLMLLIGVIGKYNIPSLNAHISSFTRLLHRSCSELGITRIQDWNPDQAFALIFSDKFDPEISIERRANAWWFYTRWVTHLHEWLNILTPAQQAKYKKYLFPKATNIDLVKSPKRSSQKKRERARRKDKTDAIVDVFPEIAPIAWTRFNLIERMKKHVDTVESQIGKGMIDFPYDIKYEERGAIMHLRAYDWESYAKSHHAANASDYTLRYPRPELQDKVILEYVGYTKPNGDHAPEPWFIELIRHSFWRWQNPNVRAGAQHFMQKHGYDAYSMCAREPWILKFPDESPFNRKSEADPVLFTMEPLWLGAVFGRLGLAFLLRMGTRLSEMRQAAVDDRVVRLWKNFGGIPGKKQISMLWYVKEQSVNKTLRENYLPREVTNILLESGISVKQWYDKYPERDPDRNRGPDLLLPEVSLSLDNPHREWAGKLRYVFQIHGSGLQGGTVTACMRFMLHGISFITKSGRPFCVSSHDFRHAFANHLFDRENAPPDLIAKVLHQNTIDMAMYYGSRNDTQLVNVLEGIWLKAMDYNTLSKPANTAPEEYRARKKEAEQKIGMLAGVLGGDCSHAGFCPNQLGCMGCVHHIPDPEKKPEVMREITRISKEIDYHASKGHGIQVSRFEDGRNRANRVIEMMDMMAIAAEDRKSDIGVREANLFIDSTPRQDPIE